MNVLPLGEPLWLFRLIGCQTRAFEWTYNIFKEGKGMMVLKRSAVAFGLFLAYLILGLSTARAEITVYDNDGQYLGILERAGSDDSPIGKYYYVKIFVPSTKMFCTLNNTMDNPDYCDLWVGPEHFETANCTGTSYFAYYPRPTYPFVSQTCTGTYGTLGEAKVITVRSRKYPPSCECYTLSEPDTDVAAYQWVPAPPPPFTLPVSLPFRYEHSTLGVEKVVIGPTQ